MRPAARYPYHAAMGGTESRSARPAASLAAVAALLAGAIWVFDRWVMPARAPRYDDPSIWEAVLNSRWVLGTIRLVGLAGALYVVLSVLARIRRGQWLSRWGPFAVDDRVTSVA